jgi:OmcA/MtrC family decaheme c-type cytochrome
MRTVGLQSYFSQTVKKETYARHAISQVITVDGDDERRVVVDNENCASCHEYLGAHGTSRMYETGVCVMCHNPSLSSSGTELDLDYPESSMMFSNLIHGIHGASVRDEPLDFVRNRSGGTRYTFITPEQLEEYPDGHVVTFPNEVGDCSVCHLDGTWMPEEISASALASTFVTTDGVNASVDDVSTARENMPNDTDHVTSPTAQACGGCHDATLAAAHMEQNGGALLWPRAEYVEEAPLETCTICHADGRVGDVSTFHPISD